MFLFGMRGLPLSQASNTQTTKFPFIYPNLLAYSPWPRQWSMHTFNAALLEWCQSGRDNKLTRDLHSALLEKVQANFLDAQKYLASIPIAELVALGEKLKSSDPNYFSILGPDKLFRNSHSAFSAIFGPYSEICSRYLLTLEKRIEYLPSQLSVCHQLLWTKFSGILPELMT